MVTSTGHWTEGKVVNGTNVGGGVFVPGTPPKTYSRLPEPTSTTTPTPTLTDVPKITPSKDVPEPTPFNETNARSSAIAQRSGEISALDNLYNSRIAEMTRQEELLGKKDLARANTISAITGSMGAPEATTRAGTVERKTQDIIKRQTDLLNNEKMSKISNIFSQIDQNIQREKEIALQNDRADRTKKVDEMNKSATANVMAFANHGVTWQSAWDKSPEFQDEVRRSGQDPATLQKNYEIMRASKNSEITNFSTKIEGNNVVSTWVDKDPITGKYTPKVETTPIPGANSFAHSHFDSTTGKLLLWDDSGNSKAISLTEGSGSKKEPVSGAPSGFTTDDISRGADFLTQSGRNGYASPNIYVALWNQFVKIDGGSQSTFLKLYPPDQYIDPNDADLVPTFLQPSKEAKASTSNTGIERPTYGG